MATTTYRVFTPSPGRFLQNAAGAMWNQILGWFPAVPSFELTTYLGYRAIRCVVEDGPSTDIVETVYVGSGLDEPVPARLVLQDAGAEIQFYSNFRVGFPPETWPAVRGLFTANVIPMLAAAIDWLTTGSVGTVAAYEVTAMGGQFAHHVSVLPVFTDAEVLCWQVSVYGLGNPTGFDYQDLNGADLPAPGVGSTSQGQAVTLANIAQTLNQMANTSRVAWINNQGGFADLVSGDIVTPP